MTNDRETGPDTKAANAPIDPAIVAAIVAAVSSILTGAKVTRIEAGK